MRYCNICLVFLTFSFAAFGQSGTGVRIDGFNVITWSDSSWSGESNYSITHGDPTDGFYTIPQFNVTDSIAPVLYGSVMIGAETGDPLLNRFTPGPSYANRDHRTFGEIVIRHPKKSLGFVARYRYVDTYSDRFDRLWGAYLHSAGKRMKFSNAALTTEAFTGAHFSTESFQSDLGYTWFARWHASPAFFYPIFRRGYSLTSNIKWEKESLLLASHFDYTPSSWYYDHNTPSRYHDLAGTLKSRFNPNGLPFYGQCALEYNSALTPAVKVDMRAGILDSSKHCGAEVTAYADKRVAGNVFGKMYFAKAVSCSLLVGRIVRRKERSYRFQVEDDTRISYKPIVSMSNIAASEVRWDKKGIVDVSAAGWLHYCGNPLWEVGPDLNDVDNSPVITQTIHADGTTLFSGVRTQCGVTRDCYTIEFRAGLVMPLDNEPLVRYHIGKTGTLRFSTSTSGEHPATASITLSARDRLVYRYLYATTEKRELVAELTAPALYSLDASLRIPLLLPWVLKLFNETAFRVDVNSLRLMKDIRVNEHPFGNKIGPEIFAGFDAQIQ